MDWWDLLLEEMSAEAAAYEADGWETVELHPGDVTARDGSVEDLGLDVLVPDNEFAALETALSGGVDSYEVLRSTPGEYVAALLVVEITDPGRAVFVPVYYSRNDEAATGLLRAALEADELTLILRTLTDDRVELTLDRPELLVPNGT
ncbi:DUF7529 family protein [Halobellus ruber]|uniref:CHASE domain-containing protein n=1 Tax=Halobellus ruber TaxID=2761102 RepID=A0A7J9SGF1_9EURY|nr:hypothetical protein [Halobellus ruber]MBB6645473.1 hypothetical protein [Halobellus ruber]